MDLLHIVLLCRSYSAYIPFRELFGGSFCHDVNLSVEHLECRGQGSPQLFPLTPRPSIIRPRNKASSTWALGPDKVWAGLRTSRTHNSPSKSCYPPPRTDRRVLMSPDICQRPSILVIYRFPRFLSARDALPAHSESETWPH